jgi:hypothetical protein
VPNYLDIFKYYSLRCGTGPEVERDVTLSGLFHGGDLFQRCCQPDVHAQCPWYPGGHRGARFIKFRALRDIQPGEILSVSLNVQGILYGRGVRHQRLFEDFRRIYPCPKPQPDQATSDQRREQIRLVAELVSSENKPPPFELIPNVSSKGSIW